MFISLPKPRPAYGIRLFGRNCNVCGQSRDAAPQTKFSRKRSKIESEWKGPDRNEARASSVLDWLVILVVEILFWNVVFWDFVGADFFRVSVGVFDARDRGGFPGLTFFDQLFHAFGVVTLSYGEALQIAGLSG
jgi:hypothetical protein